MFVCCLFGLGFVGFFVVVFFSIITQEKNLLIFLNLSIRIVPSALSYSLPDSFLRQFAQRLTCHPQLLVLLSHLGFSSLAPSTCRRFCSFWGPSKAPGCSVGLCSPPGEARVPSSTSLYKYSPWWEKAAALLGLRTGQEKPGFGHCAWPVGPSWVVLSASLPHTFQAAWPGERCPCICPQTPSCRDLAGLAVPSQAAVCWSAAAIICDILKCPVNQFAAGE